MLIIPPSFPSLLLLLLLGRCTQPCTFPSYPASSANIMEAAPTFKAKAVVDGDIVDVSTDDFKGKWVVLLFYPKVSLPDVAVCVHRSACWDAAPA